MTTEERAAGHARGDTLGADYHAVMARIVRLLTAKWMLGKVVISIPLVPHTRDEPPITLSSWVWTDHTWPGPKV